MSDIHGNRHALEAVVADAAALGVDRWWVLGDLVAIGPDPVATIELIAELPRVEVISGNTERYVLTDDRPPPHAADVLADPDLLPLYGTVQALVRLDRGRARRDGWLDWLRRLPPDVRMELPDGPAVLGVHAFPGRDDGPGITPAPRRGQAAPRPRRDRRGHRLRRPHAPTHRPVVGDVRAVNLGSVSNPITDDLRASYAVLHADRHGTPSSTAASPTTTTRSCDAVARSGHPAADFIASFQRGEQVRHPAVRPGARPPRPDTASPTSDPMSGIPPYVRTTGLANWNRYAAVNDEFIDIHMDDDSAKAVGMPGVFGMGNLRIAYLHNLLADWLGDDGDDGDIAGPLTKPLRFGTGWFSISLRNGTAPFRKEL